MCRYAPLSETPTEMHAAKFLTVGLIAGALLSIDARADGDFLFLPSVQVEARPGSAGENSPGESELHYNLDLFFSRDFRALQVLGELYLGDDESELERLQLGWRTPAGTVWAGRFHTPLGYWNTQYHHGVHMQPAVHRPAVAEYEDAGGVIPTHVTGAALEGAHSFGGGGELDYWMALGAGPLLGEHLEAAEVVGGDWSEHGFSAFARIAYRPDEFSPSQMGGFAGRSEIRGEAPMPDVSQTIVGAYAHKSRLSSRVTTALYYVANEVDGYARSSFAAGYLHGEHELNPAWMVYGRIEASHGAKDDPYLILFPMFSRSRTLAGIRFDYTRRQAVSMEVSQMENMMGTHTHVSLQWSAMYP